VKAVLTDEGIHADRNVAHRIDLTVDLLPDANAVKARFRGIERLEHFPTKWIPVRHRKCGKIKDLEQRPIAT